ncbi:hypothetical protein KGF43_15730 [Clostridioides sp. ZZV14-6044]|uniref:hypothetical protein n=1 Tax=Clostridioides sp. ZZV14-6044 TaxID=2811488 RepID=UPI001C1BA824|nr:hypothetical protein [Clostridioides sp. ZZV14-6044]HBF5866207.1 hypothetical protein [Clostridioides difficile]
MGTIRNRMVIVGHYDEEKIKSLRKNAINYFSEFIINNDYDYSDEWSVENDMISQVLTSFVNTEYAFVIMGDCSKLGWETSEKFYKARHQWVNEAKKKAFVFVVDFGEDFAPQLEYIENYD